MGDITFDIAKHWLPVDEKLGSIENEPTKSKVITK